MILPRRLESTYSRWNFFQSLSRKYVFNEMARTCCSGVLGVSCSCPLEGGRPDCSWQASQPVACEAEHSASFPSSLYGPGALEQTVLKPEKTRLAHLESIAQNLTVKKHDANLMQSAISRLPCPTGVVGQCAALPVLSRGDEVPDEALDVLISAVVEQAVGQECAADGLYVSLPQRALEASVGQDVTPSAPAMHSREYKLARAPNKAWSNIGFYVPVGYSKDPCDFNILCKKAGEMSLTGYLIQLI